MDIIALIKKITNPQKSVVFVVVVFVMVLFAVVVLIVVVFVFSKCVYNSINIKFKEYGL